VLEPSKLLDKRKRSLMPPFTIRNAQGEAIAGDTFMSPGLEKMADDVVGGYIVDDATGEKVYPVEETTDETIPPLAGTLPVESSDGASL